MARMIPGFVDENAPPGEKDVFSLLSAGMDDWIAIHSLDLAPWNRGLRTEIDFVIIIPDTGLLCVEVKSQTNIAFDGERWQPESIKRSPFKQAADGRYTFYRRLSKLAPQLKHVPVVHICIFPKSVFNLSPNLSVQPWELMDSTIFLSFCTGKGFCSELKTRALKSIKTDSSLRMLDHGLFKVQIESIVGYCVPVQKRHPDAREEIKQREKELDRILRDQQKPVLKLTDLNRRVVVSGPAGSGKTLVAMEIAMRAAEKGCRVALLCFNQLIGDWMRHKIEKSHPAIPNLVVGRAIQVMAKMADIEVPTNPPPKFWDIDLPMKLEERLTDPEFKTVATFDYFVLDEAQDLMARPWLWQSLFQFLEGGVNEGALTIFGDFDYQVLTDRNAVYNAFSELESAKPLSHWKLSENCRNYRIIGDTAVQLAGIKKSVYTGYLRIGGSVQNYDIFFYDDEQTQFEKLCGWLNDFELLEYRPDEITLLSFRTDNASIAERLKRAGYNIKPAWQNSRCVSYASVHSFKGMENKVIILTDVALGSQDFHRDLFYTGITRGTEVVHILCDKSSKQTLVSWLSEGAEK